MFELVFLGLERLQSLLTSFVIHECFEPSILARECFSGPFGISGLRLSLMNAADMLLMFLV